jgi:hypothetical protein
MNYSLSENFKEKLFKERVSGTPFAAYWDYCPEVNGVAGLSRGYMWYKFLQVIEKEISQIPENEERDIKESTQTTN